MTSKNNNKHNPVLNTTFTYVSRLIFFNYLLFTTLTSFYTWQASASLYKAPEVHQLQMLLEESIANYKQHNYDQALALLDHLITLTPDNSVFWYNKAYMLKSIGKYDSAIPCYEKVLSHNPEHEHAHYGLAQACLAVGDLARGFYHFQWRLTYKKKWEQVVIPEKLDGIEVVLRTEFGFGDMFQFVRYAQTLKERGARVTVQAFKQQVPLFKLCPYIDEVIEEHQPLPVGGIHIPLLSVPQLLGTTLETIPATLPYLYAREDLVRSWALKLNQDNNNNNNFKIGICWQGKSQHFLEENPLTRRSVPLALFAPLAALDGVTLYSLQNGEGTEQLAQVDFKVHDFGPDFDTTAGRFMDTAAVIKNMDLIISVDTSLVHLAGGLGTPTWVLIPSVAEWRWLAHRTDTPWYPEIMRLFRQPATGDWNSVISDIVVALQQKLAVKKISDS